ncbi:MAG: RNA-binding transcriptional accessory protein [Desulfobacterales bacterium]|nr:RNA-binding transcriptional accessory protein [Desulfobacterales bacterium]
MNNFHIQQITEELGLTIPKVQAVAELFEQGSTIPFIARYRKEATGSLDEVIITAIRDRLNQLSELDSRRESILKSLEQNGHLTDELKTQVEDAPTLSVLEDIYLPYKPKRRTKGIIAREKGLEPLALLILEQKKIDPYKEALSFIDHEKGVESVDDALSGSRDIIAEIINEDQQTRTILRDLFFNKGIIKSKVATDKETEGAKYRDYFDWEESVSSVPSHRLLAMRRGEKEDILNLTISPSEDEAIEILEKLFVKGEGEDSKQVATAIKDCYKRLLSRSMETEVRLLSKEKADTEAIRVFSENMRQLLLAAPMGAKRVMAIDPGFRTGCKVACMDRQGKLIQYDTIFPNTSERKTAEATEKIKSLCAKYKIEAIAVGNGTAGRETETFINNIPELKNIQVTLVNESGASIYSASEVAREEFPDLDLTVRGAVSIGRRLMDPLAELVKIDPKSIGVGQYQHDVDQTALKNSLDDVVMSCVNGVGVDLNRASSQLLQYVSGIGPRLAKNIVVHRDNNGPFTSRKKLKDITGLGPKAFEQSAGFLRISNADNPLDTSSVHPESYHIVNAMVEDLVCSVEDIMKSPDLRNKIDISKYVTGSIGIPTLNDICEELAKPGRDPREEFEEFSFASGIEKISDLRQGMKLPGIVTNITKFGVFVDIGVHQDGLVHISQMADRFVKDPADIVKVHQKIQVTVLDIDTERNRISLSMKAGPKTDDSEKKSGKTIQKRKTPPKKREEPKAFNNPFAEAFKKL